MCTIVLSFSSAAWANIIAGQKLSVRVSVCVLTRVGQITTSARRDLLYRMHRPTDELWPQTKN